MTTLDRASVVDANFLNFIRSGCQTPPYEVGRDHRGIFSDEQLLTLFNSQLLSRCMDIAARQLKESGQGFYTIGSSGHEANAAIAMAFANRDPALLHYRSGGFFVQRYVQHYGELPLRAILLSLQASSDDPISGGRHKVWGDTALNIIPQTSTIASHLPKSVGLAYAIQHAKQLRFQGHFADDAVVLCSFGDASFNHSTTQGALNAAAWIIEHCHPLPICFVCEDNGLGISVPTPQKWIANRMSHYPQIHYLAADGHCLVDAYVQAQRAADIARNKKQPVFLHLKLNRLMGHAGSDVESQYLSEARMQRNEAEDPLCYTAARLLQAGVLTAADIADRYETMKQQIAQEIVCLADAPRLDSAAAVMASIIPPIRDKQSRDLPSDAQRAAVWGSRFQAMLAQPRHMAVNINTALTELMLQYPNMLIYGEDVAVKGGVYRITADLAKRFGRKRVFDTLLDEQTILGMATGLAQNGFLPVPEIQFLAYYHNAEDQIRGEAATQSFFSNGQYTNPMVIRIASLAYQKGFGGHFHNDNSIAALRDLPGVIIACPSNGADAVRLLRSCLRLADIEQRVVFFLEPIALYMTKDLHQPGDKAWSFAYPQADEITPLGEIRCYPGDDQVAIISYANGLYLSLKAAETYYQQSGIRPNVIDLCWLAPLPIAALREALSGIARILIVDECRRTGSLSEGLMVELTESLSRPPIIHRLTAEDSFIPLGDAWQHVLPSEASIVDSLNTLMHRTY